MKTLSIFFFLTLPFIISAQQVPNGNFEDWTQSANYSEPTGWDTPNSISASLGVVTVSKETSIVQNGSSSVKIQSKSIFGTPIPGLITLGDFDINLITSEATITGGAPFTQRPVALHGYFQYEPVFNDEAFVGVILLKQNGINWDTIADGSFSTTANIVTWTPFTATLNYHNNDVPTHLNIIIISSDRNAPQPNSTLYIDNLTLSYPASVQSVNVQSPGISYSNGNISIIHHHSQKRIREIEIFNLPGQRIVTHNLTDSPDNSFTIPFRGYPPGIYISKLTFTDGSFFTGKFMVD
jgi:hypothetical protein